MANPRRGRTLNVAIATETRAEYWLLRPIYRAVERQRGLRPTFLASGTHHLARYGRTIDSIRADSVRVRELRTAVRGDPDDPSGRAVAIARAVNAYAHALLDFDWLVVLGDRLEMLAAAVAATALGLPVAHLHGGDVAPGARDDAVRHAITKLAHLHFAATADSARRIRKLGEAGWRIRVAGAPAVDSIRQMTPLKKAALDRQAGFDTGQPFAMVVQHAAGYSARQEQRHFSGTLRAVADSFERAVVIGPGLDPGSSRLHQTIEQFVRRRGRNGGWTFSRSLDQPTYFALLARAKVLVGNSSSGIIESGYFRVPAVDVGPRQQGRLRSGNVVHCDYGRTNVAAAIQAVLYNGGFRRRLSRCRCLYGAGRAGQTVARALARVPIDRKLLVKRISY